MNPRQSTVNKQRKNTSIPCNLHSKLTQFIPQSLFQNAKATVYKLIQVAGKLTTSSYNQTAVVQLKINFSLKDWNLKQIKRGYTWINQSQAKFIYIYIHIQEVYGLLYVEKLGF